MIINPSFNSSKKNRRNPFHPIHCINFHPKNPPQDYLKLLLGKLIELTTDFVQFSIGYFKVKFAILWF